MTLVGDFMPGGVFSEDYNRWRDRFIPDAARVWFEGDVVFANLECACSNRGDPMPGKILVYSASEPLAVLAKLNARVVSLANNHILDYGIEAAQDTMAELDRLGIRYAGVGRTLAEARRPALLRTPKGLVAALCFSWTHQWVQGVPAASEDSTGINPLKLDHVLASIREVRREYEPRLVLVSLHWGEGKSHYPRPGAVREARAIAEGGADVIVGHHSHCLQGYEVHRGTPIFYGLGNFIASHYRKGPDQRLTHGGPGVLRTRNLRERKTLVVKLTLHPGGEPKIELLPLVQGRDEPILEIPSAKLADSTLRHFERVSRRLRRARYAALYPMLRRWDEVVRIAEDVAEEGFRDLTWKTPLRTTRKLLTGRSMH
jgi:poly-gamma-glutamate synthesis protein (capsule biosynthesis protein)